MLVIEVERVGKELGACNTLREGRDSSIAAWARVGVLVSKNKVGSLADVFGREFLVLAARTLVLCSADRHIWWCCCGAWSWRLLAASVHSAETALAFGLVSDCKGCGWACLLEVGATGQNAAAGGRVAPFRWADRVEVQCFRTDSTLEITRATCLRFAACRLIAQLARNTTAFSIEVDCFASFTEHIAWHVVTAGRCFWAVANTAAGRRPEDDALRVVFMIGDTSLQARSVAVFVQCGEALRAIQRIACTFCLAGIVVRIWKLSAVDIENFNAFDLRSVACCLLDDAVLLVAASIFVALTRVAHSAGRQRCRPSTASTRWEVSSASRRLATLSLVATRAGAQSPFGLCLESKREA